MTLTPAAATAESADCAAGRCYAAAAVLTLAHLCYRELMIVTQQQAPAMILTAQAAVTNTR